MDVEPAAPPEADDGAPITIALCLDAAYAPWAATTMASCVRASPGSDVRFEILHDGSLSDGDIEGLGTVAAAGGAAAGFHAVPPASTVAGLPTTPEFGNVVWLRLYLAEILDDVSKILYLDADTFVASDVTGLWGTPLGESPLAAVANVVEPPWRPHVAALGVGYPGGYFNSGVLLMNLGMMRAEGSLDRLLGFAVDHRADLVWPDQDVLNAVFAGRWMPLHPRFNAQSALWHPAGWADEVFGQEAVREAKRAPVIRHFEGRGLCKPWHYMCPVPGYREYRDVLATTPWAHVPIEDRTAATRLIRLMPGEAQLRLYRRLERRRAARSQGHRRT
ncbi:MAG TPA: glycosyltransferase family 8 protein [Acidimicrobiales bacterium]|nr:glycosyltransferase family 8 protein [Acidimicrobiales bacterium]